MLSATALAALVPLRVGQVYPGGTRIQYGELGVSIVVPQGWSGRLPRGSEFFVMGSNKQPGLLAATGDSGTTVFQVAQELSSPLPLDAQTVMQPVGQAKSSGALVRQTYSVGKMQGHALAKVHKSGAAAAVFALGPKSKAGYYRRTLKAMIGSLRFSRPSAGVSSGPWYNRLRGMALVYMSTTSSSNTEIKYSLCADGRFFRSNNGGGFTADGVSGAVQSSRTGRWAVQGQTLILRFNDGPVMNKRISDRGDGNVYLDGYRHFLVNQASC